MSINLDDVIVSHNAAAQRYEAQVHGQLAILAYRRSNDHIVMYHTEVPDNFRGQGIASKLAYHALEDARAQHLTVIPSCSFVAAYIRRHPDYRDLVALTEQRRHERS